MSLTSHTSVNTNTIYTLQLNIYQFLLLHWDEQEILNCFCSLQKDSGNIKTFNIALQLRRFISLKLIEFYYTRLVLYPIVIYKTIKFDQCLPDLMFHAWLAKPSNTAGVVMRLCAIVHNHVVCYLYQAASSYAHCIFHFPLYHGIWVLPFLKWIIAVGTNVQRQKK